MCTSLSISLCLCPASTKCLNIYYRQKKTGEARERNIWDMKYLLHIHPHTWWGYHAGGGKSSLGMGRQKREKKKMINYFMNLSSATHHISVSFSPHSPPVQIGRSFYTPKQSTEKRYLLSLHLLSPPHPRVVPENRTTNQCHDDENCRRVIAAKSLTMFLCVAMCFHIVNLVDFKCY